MTGGERRPGRGRSLTEERIDNGRIFSVRELNASNGNGDTFSVVVTNPSGSGVDLITVAPKFTSSAQTYVEKIMNPTIDTTGTALTLRNKSLASGRTPKATAQTGGTGLTGAFSGGTSRGQEVVGGKSGSRIPGTLGPVDLSLKIPPDNSVQYKATSQSSGNDISISVSFIEEPQ